MSALSAFWRLGAFVVGWLAALGLVACSGSQGGGGAVAPPPAPTLALQVLPVKLFRFSWTDVSGATEYRVREDADASDAQVGYETVASLPSTASGHELVVPLALRVNARYVLQACNAGGCTDSAPVAVSGSLQAAVGYVKASNTGPNDFLAGVDVPSASPLALSADGSTLAVGATFESSSTTGVNGDEADDSASASGAVYVFRRHGAAWAQEAYVKAGNAARWDRFGTSVALSADGHTLAVGALWEASNATGVGGDPADDSMPQAGAVYVFTRSGTVWSQQAYVKAGNTDSFDRFGFSVAVSGDGGTLAVGAFGEASAATGVGGDPLDNSAPNSGAVYVFARSGATWSQQAYVKAGNGAAGELFGRALALSHDGHTLAVSAVTESGGAVGVGGNPLDKSAPSSGAVYVFARSGSAWSQQAYVKASNTGAGDFFGSQVRLSGDGNTLAVGAIGEDSSATGVGGDQADNAASDSGAAYVFVRSGTNWSQQAYLKAGNAVAGQRFGWSMALSADGQVLAVGAPVTETAWVYTRAGALWRAVGDVRAPNGEGGDLFGDSLALSGDGGVLAVGASKEGSAARGVGGDPGDNSAPASGAVYLF